MKDLPNLHIQAGAGCVCICGPLFDCISKIAEGNDRSFQDQTIAMLEDWLESYGCCEDEEDCCKEDCCTEDCCDSELSYPSGEPCICVPPGNRLVVEGNCEISCEISCDEIDCDECSPECCSPEPHPPLP